MIELERMTTEYVAAEDRISMTARIKTGGTARIWFTRRITDRLIPALVKVVQPRHQDPAYVEMIGEITQQSAEQRYQPQEPVRASSPDREWLISKIDLQEVKGGLAMILTGPGDEQARLVLNAELLRQWLGILRRVCQSADWTSAGWPDWMQERRQPPKRPKILH